MKKDYNYIAKLEDAIREKYGEDAIKNPKGSWTPEKERKYLQDLKEFYQRQEEKEEEKERVGEILVSKKILNKKSNRECPVCEKYSFDMKDDLYMNKFQCCFECFIQYVEGREDRWKSGWRPDKNTMAIMK